MLNLLVAIVLVSLAAVKIQADFEQKSARFLVNYGEFIPLPGIPTRPTPTEPPLPPAACLAEQISTVQCTCGSAICNQQQFCTQLSNPVQFQCTPAINCSALEVSQVPCQCTSATTNDICKAGEICYEGECISHVACQPPTTIPPTPIVSPCNCSSSGRICPPGTFCTQSECLTEAQLGQCGRNADMPQPNPCNCGPADPVTGLFKVCIPGQTCDPDPQTDLPLRCGPTTICPNDGTLIGPGGCMCGINKCYKGQTCDFTSLTCTPPTCLSGPEKVRFEKCLCGNGRRNEVYCKYGEICVPFVQADGGSMNICM